MHCLILAKAPLPGRAKTRLIPAFGPEGSAALAAAALADTFDAARESRAERVVVSFEGDPTGIVPGDFEVVTQRSGSLAERLAGAWDDAAGLGVQIGMDTPQVTGADLDTAFDLLADDDTDAVLGLAEDGGWWAIGLRRPADVFAGIATSQDDTGARQLQQLEAMGLRTRLLATKRDVDEPDDARAVAALAPHTRFAALLAELDGGAHGAAAAEPRPQQAAR